MCSDRRDRSHCRLAARLRSVISDKGQSRSGRGAGLDGPLKLTAPVTFGLASLVPRLRALTTAHPALRLDLRLEDRVVDLVLEGVDVAIRVASAPPDSPDII